MSGQKVKKGTKDDAAANGSVSATVKKAFKTNSTWEDKVSLIYLYNFYLIMMIIFKTVTIVSYLTWLRVYRKSIAKK